MKRKLNLKERLLKVKTALLQNWGLKIVAIVVAFFLWIFVVNITDPVGTQTFRNIPVKIINTGIITDNGECFEILDDSDIVTSVTIKAPRTTLQELGNSADVIIATADVNNLSKDRTYIPIDFSTSKYSDKIESIRSSFDNVYVKIETKKSVQLPIIATTSGEIESGFILGDVVTAQNQIKVSGPESVITSINTAEVDVQVTGFTDNISTISDIVFYDADRNVIPKNNLELNTSNVRVDVSILETKRVEIQYSVSGTAAEGYEATGEVELSPETILIAGPSNKVDSVSSITIPATELNITGRTSNLVANVNLAPYLPQGFKFADSSSSRVGVIVYIEPYEEATYSVYLRNIEVAEIPIGYVCEWAMDDDFVEFTVVGLAQNIEKIQLSSLSYKTDFSDYFVENPSEEVKPGVYAIPLTLNLPEGVTFKEPVYVKVKLEEEAGNVVNNKK